MYVLIRNQDGGHAELNDLGKRAIQAEIAKGHSVQYVSPTYAHGWVKSGHAHTTALWVDHQGRVKKAQANS